MSRPRGGYIGFNPAPAASAFNSAASGIWTLREAEALKQAGTWPRVLEDGQLTSALLQFNTQPTATTQLDETGKVWTNSGSPTLSSLVAKFGSSISFPNSPASYISTPRTSDLEIGTDDFTLECWLHPTGRAAGASPQFNSLIYSTRGTALLAGFIAVLNPSGKLALFISSNTSSWNISLGTELTTSAAPLNQWTHIALTRTGSTYKGWFNGTNEVTSTLSGTPSIGTGNIFIGGDTGGERFVGYIDEFRLTKKVLYASAFTPRAQEYYVN